MVRLTEKDVDAIEKALNKGGKTEVLVKAENGKAAVILLERKKVN